MCDSMNVQWWIRNQSRKLRPFVCNSFSWKRLVRINGWINRFLNNCQSPKNLRIQGDLDPTEILDSEAQTIVKAQR